VYCKSVWQYNGVALVPWVLCITLRCGSSSSTPGTISFPLLFLFLFFPDSYPLPVFLILLVALILEVEGLLFVCLFVLFCAGMMVVSS
jgi:hypothetical protein